MFTSVPASTREAVELLVQRPDALDLPQQLVRLHVVAEPVRGGVVGDREVLVAALLRRLRHVLERAAPVRERRVAVQVAPQVRLGDELRQLSRRSRPAARRGPRAAPARCRAGRAPRTPAPRSGSGAPCRDSSSSTPYSLTCMPRRTAYSRSSTLCCFEPVRCWSTLPNWSGSTTRKSICRPLWVDAARAGLAARADLAQQLHLGERLRQRGRVVRRRDDVEVLARVGHAARAAGDLDAVRGRMRAQVLDDLLADRQHRRQQEPLGAAPSSSCSASASRDVLLGLRAEPGDRAQALALGRLAAAPRASRCRARRRSCARSWPRGPGAA